MNANRWIDLRLFAGDMIALFAFPCLAGFFTGLLTYECLFIMYWRIVGEAWFVTGFAGIIVTLTAHQVGTDTPHRRTTAVDLFRYQLSFLSVVVVSELIWVVFFYVLKAIPQSSWGWWTPGVHEVVSFMIADFAFARLIIHRFYSLPPTTPLEDKIVRGRGVESEDDVQNRASRDK